MRLSPAHSRSSFARSRHVSRPLSRCKTIADLRRRLDVATGQLGEALQQGPAPDQSAHGAVAPGPADVVALVASEITEAALNAGCRRALTNHGISQPGGVLMGPGHHGP